MPDKHIFFHINTHINNPIYEKPSSGNLQSLFRSRIINASQWAIKPIERCKTNEIWKKVIISGESDYGTEVSDIDDFYNKIKCFIIEQRDSSTFPLPDRSIDFIVTDPPYGRASSTRGSIAIKLVESLLENVDTILLSKGESLCIGGDSEMKLSQIVQNTGLTVVRKLRMRVHSGLVREIVTVQI